MASAAAPPASEAPDSARADAAPPDRVQRTMRVLPAVVRREFRKTSKTTPFLIWVSFLLSFTISRAWVLLAGSVNSTDKTAVSFSIGRNIVFAGYHIHHIAIGFLLLAIAGWLALHYRGRQIARTSAVMYGIGLGFIIDELGFIIGNIRPYRGDVEVFYVAVAVGALLMSAVYFPAFWRGVREDVRGVARLMAKLPSLDLPRKQAPRQAVDRDMDDVLGPIEDADKDRGADKMPVDPGGIMAASALEAEPSGATAPGPAASTDTQALLAARWDAKATMAGSAYAPSSAGAAGAVTLPLDKDALFTRLLGRVIDILILIIFAGLLLGLAKLILSLGSVFIGLSVTALMQPILTGVLTLLIGVELFRAMVEYTRSGRIMLPFLVDAGILLGLRELALELYRVKPDSVLVAVIGGTLVALGGLRVFLVKTMLPPQIGSPMASAPAAPAEGKAGKEGE